jgi:hypothetical protein
MPHHSHQRHDTFPMPQLHQEKQLDGKNSWHFAEVIVVKELLRIFYIVVAVPLLLVLTRITPVGMAILAAAVRLLSATLLGSLLAANQMNTWGSFFLIPIILPPYPLGMPLPGLAEALISALPSAQAMQLILNSMSAVPSSRTPGCPIWSSWPGVWSGTRCSCCAYPDPRSSTCS